jgi:hypothetical protein
MRGANQKFRLSTAALYQQVASPLSQATRGTGLHDIDLANQELTHHQKDAALSLAGFLLWTRSSRLQDSSTRTLTLVPIETAIKRCHCLRLYGVDMRVGGSVTEASYRIMACKSRNYAFNHYPRDDLLPMLSSKIAMELIRGPGYSPSKKVPALHPSTCYSSTDTASLLSARSIIQSRIDTPSLSSDTPTAAQNRLSSPLSSCAVQTLANKRLRSNSSHISGNDTCPPRLLRATSVSQDFTSSFLHPSTSQRRWKSHPSSSPSNDSSRPHVEAKCFPRAAPLRHRCPSHPDPQQSMNRQLDVGLRRNALLFLSALGPSRL